MNPHGPEFPEYGGGGDTLGARRTRRAFVFCILSCCFFTGLLWFSERYLRYDRTESLFVRALTQDPSPAATFLSQALSQAVERGEDPPARYLRALAERETGTAVLRYYAEATSQAPNDPSLAMRYGAVLYMAGEPGAARTRFQAAREADPANALPVYLEASARLDEAEGPAAIGEAMAVAASANAREDAIAFPEPVWDADMPRESWWRAELQRQAIEQTLFPLTQLVHRLATEAEEADPNSGASWDNWLREAQHMSRRVTFAGEDWGALASGIGLEMKLRALEARARFAERRDAPVDSLREEAAAARAGLERLNAFEAERASMLESGHRGRAFPLYLAVVTFAAALALTACASVACRLMRVNRNHWTIGHSRTGQWSAAGAAALFAALLALAGLCQTLAPGGPLWMWAIGAAWGATSVGLAGFGLYYPARVLAAPRDVALRHSDESGEEPQIEAARRNRRKAYTGLIRRYYGMLAGGITCAICAWVIAHRIVAGLYPWEFRLMHFGIHAAEQAAVTDMAAMLL